MPAHIVIEKHFALNTAKCEPIFENTNVCFICTLDEILSREPGDNAIMNEVESVFLGIMVNKMIIAVLERNPPLAGELENRKEEIERTTAITREYATVMIEHLNKMNQMNYEALRADFNMLQRNLSICQETTVSLVHQNSTLQESLERCQDDSK